MMFVSGLAWAGVACASGTTAAGCSPLMTELECRQHRETLAGLHDPEARRAYLDAYMAMLREREVMCAGSGARQMLARAQYR